VKDFSSLLWLNGKHVQFNSHAWPGIYTGLPVPCGQDWNSGVSGLLFFSRFLHFPAPKSQDEWPPSWSPTVVAHLLLSNLGQNYPSSGPETCGLIGPLRGPLSFLSGWFQMKPWYWDFHRLPICFVCLTEHLTEHSPPLSLRGWFECFQELPKEIATAKVFSGFVHYYQGLFGSCQVTQICYLTMSPHYVPWDSLQ
jgi:hypothetical protein